jgi:hypothetical protein
MSRHILLLSLLVFCAPLTWAQRTLLAKQSSIQLSRLAASLAAVPKTQMRPFSFPEEMPLSFSPNLSQTKSGLKFILRGAGYDPLLPANNSMVLLGKANYLVASPPTRWLANVPDNAQTAYVHDLQYYGRHVPLVGQTIVRIAQLADSHPRVIGVLRLLIDLRF